MDGFTQAVQHTVPVIQIPLDEAARDVAAKEGLLKTTSQRSPAARVTFVAAVAAVLLFGMALMFSLVMGARAVEAVAAVAT